MMRSGIRETERKREDVRQVTSSLEIGPYAADGKFLDLTSFQHVARPISDGTTEDNGR
jgi:hypothetical protein